MRVLIWMFLSGALLTTHACSTSERRSESVSNQSANQNASIDTTFASPNFQATARAIKNHRPEISDETLVQDAWVINKASPDIVDYYQQMGFSREQAEEAVLLSWQEVRLRQPTAASLDPQDFRASAKDWGFLVVKSLPTGASVMVGDKKLKDPTETDSYLRPGTYRLQLSKDGYQSVTGTCEIRAGEKTEFVRALPSTNP
jgi:hypothetical protein